MTETRKYQIRRFGSEVILEEGITTGMQSGEGGMLQFDHPDGTSIIVSPTSFDYITIEEVTA